MNEEYDPFTVYIRSKTANKEDGPKFVRFVLYLDNSTTTNGDVNTNVGMLQLYGDSLTKMSEDCPNMVVEADMQPKSEIQVEKHHFYLG